MFLKEILKYVGIDLNGKAGADNSKFIVDMSNKKPWIAKLIKYYKNSRLSFIAAQRRAGRNSIFYFFCISGMIFISFTVLTNCFV